MVGVTIKFEGAGAEKAAQKMYTYLVDGGLTDAVMDECSTDEFDVDSGPIDNETRTATFICVPKSGE